MKKAVLLAIMLMLLASAVAGTLLIDVGKARIPGIFVISPENNKVYAVNNVPLMFAFDSGTYFMHGISVYTLIEYRLDGKLKGQIESKLTRDSPSHIETFSVNLTGLSDGLHWVLVTAKSDYEGYFGGSSSSFFGIVYFTVDTTPPRISIRAPLDRTYNATDVPLNFIVREPVSWMGYSLDAQANVTITGNTTLSELSYGSHNLTVYANDIAGNTGYSRTIYFSIAQKKEPKQPESEQSEPLSAWIAATIVVIAIVGAALLVYFGKIRKKPGKAE